MRPLARHTGPDAAAGAQAVQARAYTIGNDIVFGADEFAPATTQYEPGSRDGQRLIAHELTHVLQQRAAVGGASLQPGLSQPNDPAEQRADAVPRSEGVSTVQVSSGGDAVGVLARQVDETGVPAQSAGQEQPTAEEATGEEDAAGAEFGEWDAYDGDTPLAGTILPVPETPERLEEFQAADGATSAALTEDASESVEESAAPLAGDVTLQRQAKKGKPKPPTFPVPATLNRFIATIEIDLTAQTIKINWSDGATKTEDISSGRGRPCTHDDPCADQNNVNCTPVGTFSPQFRGDATFHNGKGDPMSWYVDLGVKDDQGNSRGIGIHDSQKVTGAPASHGCVRVPAGIAETINKNVIKSTSIVISGKAATKAWRDKTCPPKAKKGPSPATGAPAPAPAPASTPAV